VGREVELQAIGDAFKDLKKVVVISGDAGTGKSRLAAEFSHRSQVQGFWTAAGTTWVQTLIALAESVGVSSREATEERHLKRPADVMTLGPFRRDDHRPYPTSQLFATEPHCALPQCLSGLRGQRSGVFHLHNPPLLSGIPRGLSSAKTGCLSSTWRSD
jgi:hypothetical protein